MVKKADRAQEPRSFSGGTNYEVLPPCVECYLPSLIRILRGDGWQNVCAKCYEIHHNGGKPVESIKDWKGPTEYGRKIAADIKQKMKGFGNRTVTRSWAPALLQRAANGEKISGRSIELALAVVGHQETREPGSDDE